MLVTLVPTNQGVTSEQVQGVSDSELGRSMSSMPPAFLATLVEWDTLPNRQLVASHQMASATFSFAYEILEAKPIPSCAEVSTLPHQEMAWVTDGFMPYRYITRDRPVMVKKDDGPWEWIDERVCKVYDYVLLKCSRWDDE